MKYEPPNSRTTQWAIECLRRHDPNRAEGIEAALRAMKRLQSEQPHVRVLRIAELKKG